MSNQLFADTRDIAKIWDLYENSLINSKATNMPIRVENIFAER
jgi:hypothetical protein